MKEDLNLEGLKQLLINPEWETYDFFGMKFNELVL